MTIRHKQESPPKVLVGCPVYSEKEYITPYWIKHILSLTYPNYDTLVVDNSPPNACFNEIFEKEGIKALRSRHYKDALKRLGKAREALYKYAIQNQYNYLMSIEQDIITPRSIIETLLKHNKPIVGAPYIVGSYTDNDRRIIDYVVSASKLEKVLKRIDSVSVTEWYTLGEIRGKGLLQVKSCSFGCSLISVPVLKQAKVRQNSRAKRADDSYFFQDCYNRGIPVFLDSSLSGKIAHIKNLGEIDIGRSLKKNENYRRV